MASKRKFEEHNVTGYIHNVSPVKRSSNNNLYFNSTFQTPEEMKRIVCFDAEKHPSFTNAEKLQSPIKLSNVSIVPSRDGQGTDIQLNSKSKLTVLDSGSVSFKRRLFTDSTNVNLRKIRDIKHPSGMITVHVKVVGESSETTEFLFGRQVAKKEFVIADDTGSIFLNVWDTQIPLLTKDKYYKIYNIASRQYDSLKLTTTTQTKIEETGEKLPNISSTYHDDPSQHISGQIKLVAINLSQKCSSCKKIVVPGIKFTKCESCHMKQLTTDLVKSTVLKMNVLDDKHEIHRLTAFEQTVKTFVEKEKISSLLEDPESLEEFLLGKSVNISVYNGICRALKFIATTESCTNIVQKK